MPEHAQTISDSGLRIDPLHRRSVLRLKSWLQAPEQPATFDGQALPAQVGATTAGATRMLCSGPGEWLILSDEHDGASLVERLEADLWKQSLTLVDLSDALVGLAIRGSCARDVLSKGCGLDLHPDSFPPGRCASTRLAQLPVTLEHRADPPRFELTVARSYARYLREWLADAAVEFMPASTAGD
jgi:sarcosine oxidase subunit gamma